MLRQFRAILAYLRACLLRGTGLLWWAKRRAARRGVVVLTLHRVLEDQEFFHSSSLPGILVRKQTYEKLVAWLFREFAVVDSGSGGLSWKPARRPRIALTFDDGWLDNYHIAAPALARYHLPATIFLCPELMDQPFPFWPEQVSRLLAGIAERKRLEDVFPAAAGVPSTQITNFIIEELKAMEPEVRCATVAELTRIASAAGNPHDEPLNRTMTWNQARQLQANGVRFGSHTVSHAILTVIPHSAVKMELTESQRQIEARLQTACSTLAYPNGNYNPEIAQLARQAGYTQAFTTQRGLWTGKTDPLRIPRVNICEQKLIGPAGRFSRAMAEYALFWKLNPL